MLVTAVIRKIKPGKVSRHADKVKAKKREEESCVAWWRADSSIGKGERGDRRRRKGKQTSGDEEEKADARCVDRSLRRFASLRMGAP